MCKKTTYFFLLLSLGAFFIGCQEDFVHYYLKIQEGDRNIRKLKQQAHLAEQEALNEQASLKEEIKQLDENMSRIKKTVENFKQKLEPFEDEVNRLAKLQGGYDEITFKSGLIFVGRTPLYEKGKLFLNDRDGKTMKGSLSKISHVRFRVPGIEPQAFSELRPQRKKKTQARLKNPSLPAVTSTGKTLLEFFIKRSKSTQGTNVRSGFIHEKEQNIAFDVKVVSREMLKNHEGLQIEVFVLAKDVVNEKLYQLVMKESKTFDLNRGKTLEYSTREHTLLYDNKGGGQYGYKYYGYIAFLKDQEGNTLATKRSHARILKNMQRISQLEENEKLRLK